MTSNNNSPDTLTKLLSNRPLIVGALFLGTYFAPFLILIGLPLAYIFERRPEEQWESSHFQYLIRTFWIAILIAAVALAIGLTLFFGFAKIDEGELVGAVLFILGSGLVLAFTGVRVVLSLMKAVTHTPIKNPKSWLI